MASTGSLYGACIPTFESSKVLKALGTNPSPLFHVFTDFLLRFARLDGLPEEALEASLESSLSVSLLESEEKFPAPKRPEEGPGKEGS